jgi:uncharacterized protein (TIGR00369 family)
MDRDDAQAVLESKPFNDFLGLSFSEYEAGRVVLEMPFRDEFVVNVEHGLMHGGVLSSLLDVAGHYAVLSEVGSPIPTVDLRVDFLRPAFSGPKRGVGEVIRLGSTLAVADAEVQQEHEGEWSTVAVGRGTYSVAHLEDQ